MKFPTFSMGTAKHSRPEPGLTVDVPEDVSKGRDFPAEVEGPDSRPGRAGRPSPGLPPPGSIGVILVNAGRISVAEARQITAMQLETGEPFGETAVRMGFATAADIQLALSRQYALPCLQEGDTAVDPEVIAAFHPGNELVEHLRNLRGQIATRALDATPPLRSIAIMGVNRKVGRSFLAANLATVFAQVGARTLLIDADLASPRQHLLFRLENRAGLSSVLAKRARLNTVCLVTGLPGLAVLPSGPLPPNPHDLLARPTFGQLLRRCERDFHVILIDTPAWSDDRSARMIAAAAGAGILLVQTGLTSAADASDIAQELFSVGSKLLGVVVNHP